MKAFSTLLRIYSPLLLLLLSSVFCYCCCCILIYDWWWLWCSLSARRHFVLNYPCNTFYMVCVCCKLFQSSWQYHSICLPYLLSVLMCSSYNWCIKWQWLLSTTNDDYRFTQLPLINIDSWLCWRLHISSCCFCWCAVPFGWSADIEMLLLGCCRMLHADQDGDEKLIKKRRQKMKEKEKEKKDEKKKK